MDENQTIEGYYRRLDLLYQQLEHAQRRQDTESVKALALQVRDLRKHAPFRR